VHWQWFFIEDLPINISLRFGETEAIICSIISFILCCLFFARKIGYIDVLSDRNFGILNLFVFFMCCAIFAQNLFLFYMAVEAMGITSTILVGIKKDTITQTTNVFFCNKLASLLFLLATIYTAIVVRSLELSDIQAFCANKDVNQLFCPATIFVIACLIKGAQMPFSYWLIDATKANIFASILLHSGTIVGVGIIFIAKCYYLFESFAILKNMMIIVGLFTAIWMSCSAITHNNIKKMMACLTAAATGKMFIACGLGLYSLALLNFLCHAFYKATMFTCFAYLIAATSGEQNILKMGGLKNESPLFTDILWITFMIAVGFPFLPGFFANVPFLDSIQISNNFGLVGAIMLVSSLSTIAIFRIIVIAMYGPSRMDEITLSRVSKINSYDAKPLWLLISCSIAGSFGVWSFYEWDRLHFGVSGFVFVRDVFDYFYENIEEILQIVASIIISLVFLKYSSNKLFLKISEFFVWLFKNTEVYNLIREKILWFSTEFMSVVDEINNGITKILHQRLYGSILSIGVAIEKTQPRTLQVHVMWIAIGLVLAGMIVFYNRWM
jgi:NADH-quinone oxidoreductase subunit L